VAAPLTDRETAEVARTTAALLRAVNASDLGGVMAVWSDAGVLMPPDHASVHGRMEIERYFDRLFRQRRLTFAFTSSEIHVAGDTAFERVTYAASARPIEGGPAARDIGKGLHVYRREPTGAWRLVADIWNSDEPGSRRA